MATLHPLSSSQISSLGSYSTCEISDALLKLKVPHGGFVPDLECIADGRTEKVSVVGEAYTVKMVESTDEEAPKLLGGHFIDQAPPNSIMVISAPPHVKCASLGGLLALSASKRGVLGVVIDGRCRDLSELRSLPMPIYSRGHSTLGQSPFTRPSAINTPLTISPLFPSHISSPPPSHSVPFPSITIQPSDIIVADEDGVVCVAREKVEEVLEIAKKGREVDENCMRDLKEGKGVKETFEKWRGKK